MRLLTSDLYEGAWLLIQGMTLIKLWHSGNGKKTIVFEFAGDGCEMLLDQYRKGDAQGNIVRYQQSIDQLKDRMFGLLREEEIKEIAPIHQNGYQRGRDWRLRQRKGGHYAGTREEVRCR